MGLKEYVVRRGVQTVIAFFVLITIGFFLFRIMPGDPTAILILNPKIPPETRQLLRQRLGLDRPLWEQYFYFIKNFFLGEFGYSFHYGRPVTELIFGIRLINTLILVGLSTVTAIVIGVLLGAIAGYRRGSRLDVSLTTFSLLFYCTPVFWLGMIMLLIFSVNMKLFPIGGTTSAILESEDILTRIKDYLWHLTLPFTALVLIQIGYNFLIIRNIISDIMTEDYIVTARAKGLPERIILFRHAMKNAALPLTTMIALQLAGIFTGAVLTETVFSWEGLGSLLYEAVDTRDYPILQGLFALITSAFLIANYISDILYALLDPRVRY